MSAGARGCRRRAAGPGGGSPPRTARTRRRGCRRRRRARAALRRAAWRRGGLLGHRRGRPQRQLDDAGAQGHLLGGGGRHGERHQALEGGAVPEEVVAGPQGSRRRPARRPGRRRPGRQRVEVRPDHRWVPTGRPRGEPCPARRSAGSVRSAPGQWRIAPRAQCIVTCTVATSDHPRVPGTPGAVRRRRPPARQTGDGRVDRRGRSRSRGQTERGPEERTEQWIPNRTDRPTPSQRPPGESSSPTPSVGSGWPS